MNCKVVSKLIENEKEGVFAGATLLTADDGTTAVEQLRMEQAAGRPVLAHASQVKNIWIPYGV